MYKQFRWCLQLTSWSWDRAEGFEAAPQSKRHAWEQPVLSKGSGAEVWTWIWVKRGQRAVVEIWDDAKKKIIKLICSPHYDIWLGRTCLFWHAGTKQLRIAPCSEVSFDLEAPRDF